TSRGVGTANRGAGSHLLSLEESFNALGGCAVFLLNNGRTNEAGLQLFRFQRLKDLHVEVRSSAALAAAALFPRGGKVLFNDNQVLLDLVDAALVTVRSSGLLISPDDSWVPGNQMTVEQQGDLVSFNLLATAWSIRVNDDRFEETLFVDNKLVTFGLSALCICFIGTMTGNHASHCLVVSSSVRVLADNIE